MHTIGLIGCNEDYAGRLLGAVKKLLHIANLLPEGLRPILSIGFPNIKNDDYLLSEPKSADVSKSFDQQF